MPTYNVEEFVEKAVNSILEQTYQNFELIIIDDFSTDDTFNILKCLSKKDGRIKLFRNKKNRKIVYTLNKALEKSTGEYIARMDGDDISLPDRIEKQVKYLKNNKHVDLVGCSTISIDENGEKLSKSKSISGFKNLKKIIKFSNPVSHIWVAKREVYEKLNGYREILGSEDYDFLLRMITEGYKFDNISNYYGYKVRTREGNTAFTIGIKQRKSFDYAYALYKNRLNGETEGFNKNDYFEFIETSDSEEKRYFKSVKYLQKSIKLKSENKIYWWLYAILASILSFHQFKYIVGSMIIRIYRIFYSKD